MLETDIAAEQQRLRVTNADHEWHPRHLDVIGSLYICTLITTWIIVGKTFTFGPFIFNAAIWTYPLTCIFGDILTEIYGFNRTRRLIWMGFVCGLIFLFFTQLAIALPPSPDYKHQEALTSILGAMPRITAASYIAYVFCEFTNSTIMSKMKLWSNARNFPVRAIVSTSCAQFVDSIVFFPLAFGGVFPLWTIISITLSGWIFKTLYEILAIPLTTLAVRKLKKLEGIEHFDRYKLEILKF